MDNFEKQMLKEKQLNTDMWDIARLLISPDWGNTENVEELKKALDIYGEKYGRDVLRDLEDSINHAVYQACERIEEGWEE
jgi:hypothetical protein